MWLGQQLPITFHLVPTPAPTSTPRYVGTPISAVSQLAGPDLRITQALTGFLDLPQSDNPFGRLSPKNHTREGMEWPRQPRMAVARRQLLDQQTMAQARLRQPTAALRTHIPTHRARALFAAALGASGDLHTRPVSMQGLKIEQCRGK